MVYELPQKLTEVILGLDAESGRKWLADLPARVDEIAENWSLSVGKPFSNLSYHYVAPCRSASGEEAVLKIGFPPEQKTLFNEAKMLKFVEGRGLVRLLRFDAGRFALLLEKLTPGENLKTVCGANGDLRAAGIAAGVMRELWREPPENHSFQKLDDWFTGFQKAEKTDFNGQYLKRARLIYEELRAAGNREMLLHGDLHHENILTAERRSFLAIDPKGIVGDIGYETAAFMINHANWLEAGKIDLKERLKNSILALSVALEIEPETIRKWAYVQAVLSAWWTFEENCENWKTEAARAGFWEEAKMKF